MCIKRKFNGDETSQAIPEALVIILSQNRSLGKFCLVFFLKPFALPMS